MTNGRPLSNGSTGSTAGRLAEAITLGMARKPLQLMTHQIAGYPDFETNYEMLRLFSERGVDLVELQFPFSEPTADGPVFLRANQASLERGTTVEQCMAFTRRAAQDFSGMTFIIMTYYNILLQYGVDRFVRECAAIGVRGLIVPDAYPEESGDYLEACRRHGVDPILLVTPFTPDERLRKLGGLTGAFLYCVARKGVTGAKTTFGEETAAFLARCRAIAGKPLAVGFGIQSPEDLRELEGKCDIAAIGTRLLTLLESGGLAEVDEFLRSLGSPS